MKFSGKVRNGPLNKRLNFGGDPDHCLDTGIASRIRHFWDIREVINGYKSAAHTDSPEAALVRRACPRLPVLLVRSPSVNFYCPTLVIQVVHLVGCVCVSFSLLTK